MGGGRGKLQFKYFRGLFDKDKNNIDLSAHQWVPIGSARHPFREALTAANKTISNMNIGDGLPERAFRNMWVVQGIWSNSEAYIKDMRLENIAVYVTIPEDQTAYIGSGEQDDQRHNIKLPCIGLDNHRQLL